MNNPENPIVPFYKQDNVYLERSESCLLFDKMNIYLLNQLNKNTVSANRLIWVKIILCCAFFHSCAVPKYMHVYESGKGLDLRSGQWLINNVQADSYIENSVKEKIYQGFMEMGVDSIQRVDEVDFMYITPDHFNFNLSAETLSLLQKTTEYDYIISVDVLKIKNELSGIMISSPDRESSSIAEVTITVHDINRLKKIYHQRIIGTVTIEENDDDTVLAKSATGLIYGAINKGLKEIKKYSMISNQ